MRYLFLLFSILGAILVFGCAPSAAPAPVQTTAPASAGTTVPPVSTATRAPAASVVVEAYDDFFRPEKITITVGTKVTWVNLGEKQDHSVTLDNVFDATIKTGQPFSFTFVKPGTYQYYCVPHSESSTEGMVGTITVMAK